MPAAFRLVQLCRAFRGRLWRLEAVPAGLKAKKVHLLVSGQAPRFEETAGYVTLTVPSILYHEVVAVEV